MSKGPKQGGVGASFTLIELEMDLNDYKMDNETKLER